MNRDALSVKRDARRLLKLEIERKLARIKIMGEQKLGEMGQKGFDEYQRLCKEAIDDMLRYYR